MKTKKPSLRLPFPGFYESGLSYSIDQEYESLSEWLAEREAEDYPGKIHLNANDYGFLWECADTKKLEESIGRDWVWAMEKELSDAFGFRFPLKFEEITSPRFYNFETDRLFAATTHKAIKELFRMSRKDGHRTLERVIAERHTSRSGFHSYYNNTLYRWLAKPLRDWDHNELETLLLAALEIAGVKESDLRLACEERIYESFYETVDAALDWNKVRAMADDIREERLAEIRESDPDYLPPYRCPVTPDLFPAEPVLRKGERHA